jgi:hypothetical protein
LAVGAAAALTLGATVATAGPAIAEKPTREFVSVTNTVVLDDLCEFPVTLTAVLSGYGTFSADGGTEFYHVTEEDTFTANGKTLTSLPYTFDLHATLDEDGNYEHFITTGQVVVVPVSQGVTFRAAGRFDFIDHGDVEFVWVPDSGTSMNQDAFCAALAP